MKSNEEHYKKSINTAIRIGFIALLLVWSFEIIKPFILPVLWGLIIAVAIYPLHLRFSKLLGGKKKLSAIFITIIFLALLIAPSLLIVDSIASSLQDIVELIKNGKSIIPPPTDNVQDWKFIGKPIYDIWMLASTNIGDLFIRFAPQLKEFAPSLLSGITSLGGTIIMFLISIIIGGALLTKDKFAEKSAKSIFTTLLGEHGEGFVALSVATIRSVVQGVLGVALIQALLAGIGFWAIDMPAAGLWTLLIMIVAIIQLPASLVLLPLIIYSFSYAGTTPAVIFTIWSLIVGLSDNILKPMLLGRGVDVPMLAILLGALGGMMMSGIIGLFVGAVVLALSYKVVVAIFVNNVFEKEIDSTDNYKQN